MQALDGSERGMDSREWESSRKPTENLKALMMYPHPSSSASRRHPWTESEPVVVAFYSNREGTEALSQMGP
jgi:hypothetical protein